MLFTLTALGTGFSAQPTAQNTSAAYTPVTLCEISFNHQRANPKYVSLEAGFVNATPHGVILLDKHCSGRGLQIDFPHAGLDKGAATLKKDFYRISRAKGTFQGILERDQRTRRLYLSVQSVLSFRPRVFLSRRNGNQNRSNCRRWSCRAGRRSCRGQQRRPGGFIVQLPAFAFCV